MFPRVVEKGASSLLRGNFTSRRVCCGCRCRCKNARRASPLSLLVIRSDKEIAITSKTWTCSETCCCCQVECKKQYICLRKFVPKFKHRGKVIQCDRSSECICAVSNPLCHRLWRESWNMRERNNLRWQPGCFPCPAADGYQLVVSANHLSFLAFTFTVHVSLGSSNHLFFSLHDCLYWAIPFSASSQVNVKTPKL